MSTTHILNRLLVACKLSTEPPSGQCKERNKKLWDSLVWSAEERYIILQGVREDIL